MVIRKVLVDSFGTLMSPKPPGVVGQYAQVAAAKGIHVNQAKLKQSFGRAFSKHDKASPLYGKLSDPPLSSAAWWRNVITDAFLGAGVKPADLQAAEPGLTDALLRRFASKAAYSLHPDALPFLAKLDAYRRRRARSFLLPPAVVSGSDLSCLSVLRALGVLPQAEVGAGPGLGRGGLAAVYTTWEVEYGKGDVRFWEAVGRMVSEDEVARGGTPVDPSECLVVGDEYLADYVTPRQAGFRSLLLRRPPEADGSEAARHTHNRGKAGAESGADKVASLVEVVDFVKAVNEREYMPARA